MPFCLIDVGRINQLISCLVGNLGLVIVAFISFTGPLLMQLVFIVFAA